MLFDYKCVVLHMLYGMSLQSFYGKGPHPLLWACLWAARGKETGSGIPNYLNYWKRNVYDLCLVGTYSKWRHVKFHLSAYKQKAPYIFCLADYMFGAMCWPTMWKVLPHLKAPCTVILGVLHPMCLCIHPQLPVAPPTIATLKLVCPHLCRIFSCIGGPLLLTYLLHGAESFLRS